jgi:hypothetical protein
MIGRHDGKLGEKAHLDLTPYGGLRAGVSRMHAVLYRTQHTISLADLGSTNGTYLNSMKLVPHQPRFLRDGDEVGLGNMQFHVSFTTKLGAQLYARGAGVYRTFLYAEHWAVTNNPVSSSYNKTCFVKVQLNFYILI